MFKLEASQTAGTLLFDSCPCHFNSLCHRVSPLSDVTVLSTEGHMQSHAHILALVPLDPTLPEEADHKPWPALSPLSGGSCPPPPSYKVKVRGECHFSPGTRCCSPLSATLAHLPRRQKWGVRLGLGCVTPAAPHFLTLAFRGLTFTSALSKVV